MPRKGEPDEIWDAATEEFYESGVPDTDRTYVNRLVNALRKLKGVTPAEIHRRTAELRADWRDKRGTICTLRTLVRNWDQFPKWLSQAEREKLARQKRVREERRLAQRIVDGHSEDECEAAWQKYLVSVGRSNSTINRILWPVPVARFLEPDALERMMKDAL